MGKTYRSDPSSYVYMKKQKHAPRRRLEENAFDTLEEYPHKHHNRIGSANSHIADPWDDKIISSFNENKYKKKSYGYEKKSIKTLDHED